MRVAGQLNRVGRAGAEPVTHAARRRGRQHPHAPPARKVVVTVRPAKGDQAARHVARFCCEWTRSSTAWTTGPAR
ncbi:protein of unknown function [Modestobacter italicus]|uniref:Uncharacterized protein n=1 Tax=Modestobacter italicus (strain DSM 44449 / CECT 9708 / BC 501) TaxID=2732864 RepID=I4EQG9_MODI5|nr:protein of unknown function [Modestobacter marinus]